MTATETPPTPDQRHHDIDGTGDGHAHIGRKDEVLRGYVEGTVVRAICGARLVPSRNPERLPFCPKCAAASHLVGG